MSHFLGWSPPRRWHPVFENGEDIDFVSSTKSKYKEKQFVWEIRNFYSRVDTKQEVTYESSAFVIGLTNHILRLFRAEYTDIWTLHIITKDDVDGTKFEYIFGGYEKVDHAWILLGFKKADGNLEEFYRRKCKIGTGVGEERFVSYWTNSELLKRKPELTSSDHLTITLTFKSGIFYEPQPPFHELPPTKLISLDTLSENFKNLFVSKGCCDVTLQVKDQAFQAHKAVLIARSSVFAAMFEHDMKEKRTSNINIPDCEPEFFQEFLEYVYSGKLENLSFPGVLHLYIISDKYHVQELKSFCAQYMEESLAEDNICDVIVLAEMNNEAKLLSLARDFFCKNATKIVGTPEWENLMANYPDFVNNLIIEMASKINNV